MKNLTWQNPEQLFVAQELINKVKSKCCGIKVKNECVEEVLKKSHFVFTEEAVDEESFVEFTRRVLDKALHNEKIIKSIKQCIIFSVPKRHIAMFGIEEFEPLSGYLSNWAEGEAEYIWGIYEIPDFKRMKITIVVNSLLA